MKFTSFTIPSLVPGRTRAHTRRSAIPAIHTLRVAQCCFTMLSHVPLRTLANLLVVAPALVGAFLVALGVRPCSIKKIKLKKYIGSKLQHSIYKEIWMFKTKILNYINGLYNKILQ